MSLVEDTGFDGFDAGTPADSWRQQPGASAYCTDVTRQELPAALTAADATRSPRRRDLTMTVIAGLTEAATADQGGDFLVRVGRLIYT